MKKRAQLTSASILAALLLVGCAITPTTPTPEVADKDSVIALINESTQSAVNAQRELAMVADASVQQQMTQRKRLLTDVIDMDTYGDVEAIVGDIAAKYGYDFKVYGKRPPEGVNANILVTKRSVIEVLKHIGYTSTYFLDIVVKRDEIQIHYKTR